MLPSRTEMIKLASRMMVWFMRSVLEVELPEDITTFRVIEGQTARLIAGPTHFRADGGGGALGGQARLELVSPTFHRLAVVVSARGGLVWNLDRQDYRLGAVGLGLGIY